MFKKILPFVSLISLGFAAVSCEPNELEQIAAPKASATAVQAASANIMIEETFEGASPLSAFHGTEFGTTHAYGLTTSPVFAGQKAARIELRDTDPLESNGTRAEMTVIKDKMQKEMWFSFAVYLPAADFAYDSKKEIISQWHQSGGASPPSYLLITKDRWSYEVANQTGAHVKFDLGAVAKNVWNQFTFHYIQSNGSDGLVEIWHNGQKVLTRTGGNIYALSNLPKWKVGIYKWDWNGTQTTDVSKRVLYFDNIRVGTAAATLAEMTAGGTLATTPLPTTTTTTAPSTTTTTTTTTAPSTTTTTTTAPSTTTTAPSTTTTTTTAPTTTSTTTATTASAGKMTFVNAETDKDIRVITSGTSLSLSAVQTTKVSVRADFAQKAGSVKFVMSGSKSYTYIDNVVPYALFGDNGSGNYYYGSYIPVGSYTLTAIPYSEAGGKGTAGTPVTVKFTVVK